MRADQILIEAARRCHEGTWDGGLHLIDFGHEHAWAVSALIQVIDTRAGDDWACLSRRERVIALLLAAELA